MWFNNRMRILFAGTPKSALPTLQALFESEHELVGVLTRAPARTGRGRKISQSDVAIKAQEYGVPILIPKTLKDEQVWQEILDLKPDIVVVVAYGMIIPKRLLEAVKYGWINLHFSLLPRWRGAAPVQYAIYNGDEQTGACVFQIEEGLDTGAIYSQLSTFVEKKTACDLLEELSIKGSELVLQALKKIEEGCIPEQQNIEGITLAPKIPSDFGKIDFNAPAENIERLIRAVTDHPGAYTFLNGKRIKISPVTIVADNDLKPGHILVTKKNIYVGTKTNNLCLDRVAPSGKSWMKATDWARGVRDEKIFSLPEPNDRANDI